MIYHPKPMKMTLKPNREATTITLTTPTDFLPEVLADIERFLRAVYGWIPTEEHLVFEAVDGD